MGWFDEQIRQRAQQDDERFARAFADMAGAVLGRPPFPQTDSRQARGAIMQIIHYYRLPRLRIRRRLRRSPSSWRG